MLSARRDSTVASKDVQQQIYREKAEDIRARLEVLTNEEASLSKQIEFQSARIKVSGQTLKRERTMQARDLISLTRLQKSEQDHLEQQGRLQGLERDLAALKRDRLQLSAMLKELPMTQQMSLSEIERSTAALEQELAEAEALREIVISAPQDGTVTAIQTEIGGNASTTTPLLSIVPSGSKLQAQLFSPSRSIGFVRTGQRVLLRFQPFPYQKFGSYEGVVASVSRSALSPSELSQQMSGLTTLHSTGEPVFRVTVDLKEQTVKVYGENVPLQPGIRVEADVIIDTRRLYEWILDPLYALTGRMAR